MMTWLLPLPVLTTQKIFRAQNVTVTMLTLMLWVMRATRFTVKTARRQPLKEDSYPVAQRGIIGRCPASMQMNQNFSTTNKSRPKNRRSMSVKRLTRKRDWSGQQESLMKRSVLSFGLFQNQTPLAQIAGHLYAHTTRNTSARDANPYSWMRTST